MHRFLRRFIAFVVLALSVLWWLNYDRHGARHHGSPLVLLGVLAVAVALVALWVLLFAHDPAPWVAAGRTMGFKSVYSERLPKPPFPMPEHISDLLGRTAPEFDVYLAHRCEQSLVVTTQRGLFSGRDRDVDDPPLLGDSDQSLTAPYPVETFALINSRRLMLPAFDLRPEGVIDKLAGRADVDFDSHPKFSSRYLLWGVSEDALRTLFTQGLLDFFSERPGWHIEGRGGWLLIRRENEVVSAKDLPAFVREVLELHAALTDACA